MPWNSRARGRCARAGQPQALPAVPRRRCGGSDGNASMRERRDGLLSEINGLVIRRRGYGKTPGSRGPPTLREVEPGACRRSRPQRGSTVRGLPGFRTSYGPGAVFARAAGAGSAFSGAFLHRLSIPACTSRKLVYTLPPRKRTVDFNPAAKQPWQRVGSEFQAPGLEIGAVGRHVQRHVAVDVQKRFLGSTPKMGPRSAVGIGAEFGARSGNTPRRC
jgi:hypothetical protein